MLKELFILAYDIFWGIVILGFMAALSYIVAMWVVDFPCTAIEELSKKKIPESITTKIKIAITIILTLFFASKVSILDIIH